VKEDTLNNNDLVLLVKCFYIQDKQKCYHQMVSFISVDVLIFLNETVLFVTLNMGLFLSKLV